MFIELTRRFFFFKQKTAYEMRISDWSSDVCSSDLAHHAAGDQHLAGTAAVANPHQLEQLVEFDEVAVELEVELVHGETGEASTTASPLMLTNGSTAMVRRSSNGADVVGVACTSGAAAGDRKRTRLNSSH